ncbi:MAG: tRNA (adenosine(37)-N6)-threonylcarbamoyltransferase complex dimerization subunit type 1 TsaB [Planktotalea sp.]|uniref:tRNA (adenosine(37)-N6)-threonylcarbamoyltransferase complex dimerization subunit type 1 TsaB n=1 Tax=Planktotalea sp. TaxID=2029877 RepID=UPI003C74A503
MIVLGFDTSAAHCAAAIWKDGQTIEERREPMKRGQAERLMGLIEDVLSAQSIKWCDLDAIGVGIGPGNFTGIRICVSAARGLALGLGIPAIGVDRFDVIEANSVETGVPSVPATQDNLYIRQAGHDPKLVNRIEAENVGETLIFDAEGTNPAIAIAQIAASRISTQHPRPAPLYIKAADAAPARDAPPTILP